MPSNARPTLAMVAARAGVSPSTASLAFAGSPKVAAKTRQRVLAAARELHYAGPNPIAASLRRGRSGIVGAFVGERLRYAFHDPVAVALLDGITEVLGPHGVGLLLLAGDVGRPSLAQLARIPLDAAIFATCGSDNDPALDLLLSRGTPLIAVDGPANKAASETTTLIDIDDHAGTAALARYLRALGHRAVATIAMPLRLDGTRGPIDASRRAQAHFRDVRDRLNAVFEVFGPVPAYETASNSVDEGDRAARVLLDVPEDRRPTAILAQSDILAAGVLRAAADLGLRVPEQLSVAGFDGADLPWLHPVMLTTVVQPSARKGRAAGHAVVELLAGRRPARQTLPVALRIGTTTGPPPG